MVDPIGPITQKLNQEDFTLENVAEPAANVAAAPKIQFEGNLFEDVLSKAVEALNGVSQQEIYANQMIDQYTRGEVDMADVMLATSKMNIMVNLAVTVVNSAVTSFKEVTQMQI
ncbi:MAG: flagellar hook-basal body complex protein FliE [Candidatus Margulisiibacteriota bacterium]